MVRVSTIMADNVHRKSHKQQLDGSRKISNTVHRTTSETIRLGVGEICSDARTHGTLSLVTTTNNCIGNVVPQNNQCRKKTSSFQITSVTVGSRMSNDAGDDSNDDLDESHTEDNSIEHSRVTDLDVETPSYSEDTFSKEDVFFNASNAALSTAPVIPTSSQYGLAIVPSEGGIVSHTTNDSNINTLDITSVNDNNIINLLSSNVKQDTDIRDVHSHGRNERFKVVKIESTEPFKRGRWTCMDYLDHTSVNQSSALKTQKLSDPNEVCISYGVTDGGIVVTDTNKQHNNINDDPGISIDTNGHVSHQDIHTSSIGVVNNSNFPIGNSINQNVQQQHNANQLQSQAQVPTQQMPQYFQPSNQQQQPQQQQQQPQQQLGSQQQQQSGQQGATLPSNLQPTHPNNLGQPQSMPQGSIPIITQTNNNNVTPQQNISHQTKDDTSYATVTSQNQSLSGQNVCQTSVQQSSPSAASQSPNILVPQHQSQQQQQQQQQQQALTQTQKQMAQLSEPMNSMQGMQGIQNIHKVPQSGGQQPTTTIHGQGANVQTQGIPTQGQMQSQTGPSNPQVQINQVTGNCQNVVGGNTPSSLQNASMSFHQNESEQDSVGGLVPVAAASAAAAAASSAASQSADTTLLESLAEVTQSSDDHHALEDNESMSGTSAVAIDNKIEQAMDLVKSHLMFAVREEVEVLKEKIAELMDRINQLEAENSILKVHATPETLAQLSQTTTKLPQNNSGSGQ